MRVLWAENQTMGRGALSALISMEDDIKNVAQASRGDEMLPAALDVALLDIKMPGEDGRLQIVTQDK